MISSALFIMVAESMVIFRPIAPGGMRQRLVDRNSLKFRL